MQTSVNSHGTLIINDAYNANPASSKAALTALAKTKASNKVAFLGTMGELGPDAQEMHHEVTAFANEKGITVYAVDSSMYGDVTHLESQDAAFEIASGYDSDYAVLVKGSRSNGLEVLAERIAEI